MLWFSILFWSWEGGQGFLLQDIDVLAGAFWQSAESMALRSSCYLLLCHKRNCWFLSTQVSSTAGMFPRRGGCTYSRFRIHAHIYFMVHHVTLVKTVVFYGRNWCVIIARLIMTNPPLIVYINNYPANIITGVNVILHAMWIIMIKWNW